MSPVAPNRRPVIEVAPGGPYVARGIDTLVDEDGLQLSTDPDMALCRCGHSSAKPFCDGTHAKREFTAELQQEFPAKREYAGRNLTVHYNPTICAHVGYCTARLSSVFNVKAKPWIHPDGAPEADVVTTIAACPSGALSHLSDGARDSQVGGHPVHPGPKARPLGRHGHRADQPALGRRCLPRPLHALPMRRLSKHAVL